MKLGILIKFCWVTTNVDCLPQYGSLHIVKTSVTSIRLA